MLTSNLLVFAPLSLSFRTNYVTKQQTGTCCSFPGVRFLCSWCATAYMPSRSKCQAARTILQLLRFRFIVLLKWAQHHSTLLIPGPPLKRVHATKKGTTVILHRQCVEIAQLVEHWPARVETRVQIPSGHTFVLYYCPLPAIFLTTQQQQRCFFADWGTNCSPPRH